MIENLRKINKFDVVKFSGRDYEAFDRIDLFNNSEKLEKSLFRIEIRLKQKESDKSALVIKEKGRILFFDEDSRTKDRFQFVRNTFHFMKKKYKLVERMELLKSENSETYFEKVRFYILDDKYILVEKKNDEFSIFTGNEISENDLDLIAKGGKLFVPNRNFIRINDIVPSHKSLKKTVFYSVLFLFLGLLYVSPLISIAGFAVVSVTFILFGWKGIFAAPFICLLLGIVESMRINKKQAEF